MGLAYVIYHQVGLKDVSFLQSTGETGIIEGFYAFTDFQLDKLHPDGIVPIPRKIIRRAGDPGIFAFYPLAGRRIMGTMEVMKRRVRRGIDNLRDKPHFGFRLWEISGFLEDPQLSTEAQQVILDEYARNFPGTKVEFGIDDKGMIRTVGIKSSK